MQSLTGLAMGNGSVEAVSVSLDRRRNITFLAKYINQITDSLRAQGVALTGIMQIAKI